MSGLLSGLLTGTNSGALGAAAQGTAATAPTAAATTAASAVPAMAQAAPAMVGPQMPAMTGFSRGLIQGLAGQPMIQGAPTSMQFGNLGGNLLQSRLAGGSAGQGAFNSLGGFPQLQGMLRNYNGFY